MTTAERPPTLKQERFVAEYLIDGNATQAAIRAGYSERTARFSGHENLTKPYIAAAVESARAAQAERTEIDADWVQARLVELIERGMQVEPVHDRSGKVIEGEFTFQGAVANTALALLTKRTGGFEQKGAGDVNVNLTIMQLVHMAQEQR